MTLAKYPGWDSPAKSRTGVAGSPKLELDTEIQNTGEYWEFSGTSQTAFCSFNYAGYADSNNLKLYITDAALKGAVISPQV